MRDLFRKTQRIAIYVAQFRQRDYSSGGSVRISRIKLVMVVFRPSIRKKEARAPEFVATPKRFSELRCRSCCAKVSYPRQRGEQKGRMKVIDPGLIDFGTVLPGAILTLLTSDIASGT